MGWACSGSVSVPTPSRSKESPRCGRGPPHGRMRPAVRGLESALGVSRELDRLESRTKNSNARAIHNTANNDNDAVRCTRAVASKQTPRVESSSRRHHPAAGLTLADPLRLPAPCPRAAPARCGGATWRYRDLGWRAGGALAVWSEMDAGTEVELRVPASNAFATAQRRSWISRIVKA